MHDYTPPKYTDEQLDHMAKHGTVQEKITVVSRHNVPQETLEWLMANDTSDEVKIEIIARPDVTADRLVWASNTDNGLILGRVAGNDKTPLETVRAIKVKADSREGEVWTSLSAFASRVITRRETGKSQFDIPKGSLPESPQ